MALKRKMDFDDETVQAPMRTKQQKLVPFPNTEPDNDVAMTDASVYHLEPLLIPMPSFHTRLPSDASYSSSTAGDSPRISPAYPYFDLYPADDNGFNAFDSPVSETSKSVGLLQPKNPSFTHHGQNCSQIPKLRVACSPGLNGQRTMWAHCEQCGAIEMVHTD